MENNNSNQTQFLEQDTLDFKKEISYFLFFWPWFLISIIIALLSSYYYLRYTNSVYQSNAQIQITTDSDATSFITGGQTNLFGGIDRNFIDNDIAVITSQHILSQVVKKLELQTKVFNVGTIKNKLKFKDNLPFKIILDDNYLNQQWEISVSDNKVFLNSNAVDDKYIKDHEIDLGQIKIIPKDSSFLSIDNDYLIINTSLNNAINQLRNSLDISAGNASWGSEIVNLKITGTNTLRNESILNTLIQILADDQVSDKREISEVSLAFIDERLKILSQSIDSISNNTINYQVDNKIFNAETQTNSALNNIVDVKQESFNLGIQLQIANGLKDHLENHNINDILPANVGVDNPSLVDLYNKYNELVFKRNKLMLSATNKSPVIIQINRELEQAKESIVNGVNSYIESLEISLNSFLEKESNVLVNAVSLPAKENYLRAYSRNFKIAEELYTFLLRRKEEASISYMSALSDLKILSYGVSVNTPIFPKGRIIYLVALFFSLAVPFLILAILKFFDTKINTRDDLEKGLKNLSILGELPFDEEKNINDSRGIIAEATRVLRSSLSFLIKKEAANVILVTSTTKGEGKSFVSFNLAESLKALNKKVILVGGDLRNPQLHSLLGINRTSKGLSTFLSDDSFNDIDSLITVGNHKNSPDFLLSGAIPPNPSELLMRPRMKELLDYLKQDYDYVLIDTAPLMLVSDTTPLLPLTDLVVYVVRAQYSDKNIFPFISSMSNTKDMPPFALVLNGLIAGPNRGYNYRYAYRYSYRYRYSYSYKYNYGYGYGYGKEE